MPYLLRRTLPLVGITFLGACATSARSNSPPSSLATGAGVMEACKQSQFLVVENKTAFPVSVTAVEGHVNSPRGSSERLWTVQSGGVDTIGRIPPGLHQVVFGIDRPMLPSGAMAPVRGLRAWCAVAAD